MFLYAISDFKDEAFIKFEEANNCKIIQVLITSEEWNKAMIVNISGGAQLDMVWNDYFTPMLYLVSPKNRTISLGMKNFSDKPYGGTDYQLLFAALCIVSIPIIIVFLMFRNLFITGITAASVKE